mgnify:CR=1 FL=1
MNEKHTYEWSLKQIKRDFILLFIITTIYLLIKYFFPSPHSLIYASFPFPFLVPSEPNHITDFLGVMLSIIISYQLIKIVRLILKRFNQAYDKMGKKIEGMHKGWLRVHTLVMIVLVCCFIYYYSITRTMIPQSTAGAIFDWLIAVACSASVIVIVYCFLLSVFLWIKDGFKSNK